MSDTEQLPLEAPAAPAAPVVLNTPHARDMLRKRYSAPEWALLEEVAPATGGGTRYADAIAVNLWSSRGHAIHGFEIKVSRGDWQKELRQPEKAEPIYRFCDHWWIVAPKGIVKDGELPPTWGLLEVRATGLVQVVAAPRLKPEPITRAFFASLMRRGHEQLERLTEIKVHQALADSRAELTKRIAEGVEQATYRHRDLKKAVDKFHEQTGLSISAYAGPPVHIIKLAQQLGKLDDWKGEGGLKRLERLATDIDRAAATVREAIATFNTPEPTAQQADEQSWQ